MDRSDPMHFTGYKLFLLIALIPFYAFLKLMGYDFIALKHAASISWIHMANLFPEFATGIYIYCRSLSGVCGALTVYVIYLIGKEIYDTKTGLFSAALLSVTLGFIGVNHFAKYIALLNLLIVVVIFFCLRFLNSEGDAEKQKKSFLGASFIAGYAASTNPNGILLAIILSLAFLFKYRKRKFLNKDTFLIFVSALLCYSIGFICATPSLITHFQNYWSLFENKLQPKFQIENVSNKQGLFIGPLNMLFEIWSIYGFAIFILVVAGIIHMLRRLWRLTAKEWLVFSFVCLYYFSLNRHYTS